MCTAILVACEGETVRGQDVGGHENATRQGERLRSKAELGPLGRDSGHHHVKRCGIEPFQKAEAHGDVLVRFHLNMVGLDLIHLARSRVQGSRDMRHHMQEPKAGHNIE